MSSTEEKTNKNTKARAHAVAGWEWFKSAAWLQVILIVGVVVGVVVAIPYIVSAVQNQTSTSDFYESKAISYKEFQNYLDGKDSKCNGAIGDGNSKISDDTEGFTVIFYKDNDSDTYSSLEGNVETWYKNFNSKYANGKARVYTIDVAWVPGDAATSKSYEGSDPATFYQNDKISLSEQYDIQQAVKDVYDAQDDKYKNSSVTDETLDKILDTSSGGSTMPTPCFINYTKKKTESTYAMNKPTKVIFQMEGSLSASTASDVVTQMNDIINFAPYTKQS
jgi:hypothetical protein